VSAYVVQELAGAAIQDIYAFSVDRWGETRANVYVAGLFQRIADIAERRVPWRAVPRTVAIEGYYARYRHHFIFWRVLSDGRIGVVAVLHERMKRDARLRTAFDR
jgi:toxin ParE1/3/4